METRHKNSYEFPEFKAKILGPVGHYRDSILLNGLCNWIATPLTSFSRSDISLIKLIAKDVLTHRAVLLAEAGVSFGS